MTCCVFGRYELDGLEDIDRVRLETPYGDPSDAFITGVLAGRRMVFLPRHGAGHRLLPHELNYRANVWGMKKLGVDRLISVSAVGSLQENIEPGHLVLVDQFIDRTRHRPITMFGDGVVAHVPMADPVCNPLRSRLFSLKDVVQTTVHNGGTYLCMEGPQFSTRAESQLYRQWGCHVIGMTNMPEAKLAREAEICYVTLALATDYDCWRTSEDDVSLEAILAILKAGVEQAKTLLKAYVEVAAPRSTCQLCGTAAEQGLMTPPDQIPPERRAQLAPIFDRFLNDA
ncbi:MAG: S-methyl-5'-thioadenosine phosphorylase [Myxococcota bacterium]